MVTANEFIAEKSKYMEQRLMFLRPEHREFTRQLLNELEAWDQETHFLRLILFSLYFDDSGDALA